MDVSRKRLRPWLEAKIDSGSIPGLYWVDEGKTLFRIPWKHGGKQDWSPEDSQIFMEWAKHTGRFREGMDKPNYAQWKTRLRCAFNKAPDIKERKEMNNLDDPRPFKVYEFLAPKVSRRLTGMTDDQPDSDSDEEKVIQPPRKSLIPQTVKDVAGSNDRDSTSMSLSSDKSLPSDLKGIRREDLLVRNEDGGMTVQQIMKEEDMDCSSGGNLVKEDVMVDIRSFPTNEHTGAPTFANNPTAVLEQTMQQPNATLGMTNAPVYDNSPPLNNYAHNGGYIAMKDYPAHDVCTDVNVESHAAVDQVLSDVPATSSLDGFLPSGMTLQQLQEGVEVEMLSGDQLQVRIVNSEQDMATVVEPAEKYQLQGHEMLLKIQYCEEVVDERWIVHPGGCRLYYGTSHHHDKIRNMQDVAEELIGPSEVDQIHMPPSNGLYKIQRQASNAKELLNCMERGLLLECKDGDIYARRLCRCVLYYSSPYHKNGEPIKLSRQNHHKIKVFDYQQEFLPAFKAYRSSGNQLLLPCAEVHFGIGQPWKHNESAVNILMSLRVFSGKAVADLGLIPDAQSACPGSATGVQISDKDVFDELNSGLKNCGISDPPPCDGQL